MRTRTALSIVASGLGLLYGAYRGYYALGATAGMIGVPSSRPEWLLINRVGAAALLLAALVPLIALPLWERRPARWVLLTLFSIAAVGLSMHALIDETQRLLDLAGLAGRLHINPYRFGGWRSVDVRAGDLQDILLNEPWFLIEGLTCGALVLSELGRRVIRVRWLAGAGAATLVCTVFGLLSATGVIGSAVIL
ncbi:MAG TPA: hypothetical protein VIA06_14245 [Candidatus Dormibacteraeota bacterium]|nr:hypothetical protein [Candidatus Dormibacteraeota bacterium]